MNGYYFQDRKTKNQMLKYDCLKISTEKAHNMFQIDVSIVILNNFDLMTVLAMDNWQAIKNFAASGYLETG